MNSKRETHWYRVEVSATGKIVNVVKQTKPSDDTKRVFYVQATGSDAAGRLAMNRYSAQKVRDQRARYKAEGKCPCGRERDRDGIKCSVCISNNAASRERSALRKQRGEPPGRDDALRFAKSAARTRDRRAEMRHEVLLELEQMLANVRTLQAARVWARREIRRLQGLPLRSVA